MATIHIVSATGRAKCQTCSEMIPKDEPEMMETLSDTPKHFHLQCWVEENQEPLRAVLVLFKKKLGLRR